MGLNYHTLNAKNVHSDFRRKMSSLGHIEQKLFLYITDFD